MRPLLGVGVVLLIAIALAGCGGDDDEGDEGGGGGELTIEGDAAIPGDADPAEARVIDAWSTALRSGDVEAAAGYFELPSVAQNGTPAVQLRTRREVIAFNEALPCGAELVRAVTDGPYTVATFELTERPGPGECGAGVGETARTAFLIEKGLIARWIRAPVDTAPPAEGPVV